MTFETRLTPAMAVRWRGAGLWSDESLATVLARRVREAPDREAPTDDTHRLTYRELAHGIDRMAARLRDLHPARRRRHPPASQPHRVPRGPSYVAAIDLLDLTLLQGPRNVRPDLTAASTPTRGDDGFQPVGRARTGARSGVAILSRIVQLRKLEKEESKLVDANGFGRKSTTSQYFSLANAYCWKLPASSKHNNRS